MDTPGLNSRQRAALEAFKVEGYDDEFIIPGHGSNVEAEATSSEDDLFEVIPVRPTSQPKNIVDTVAFLSTATGTIIAFGVYMWLRTRKKIDKNDSQQENEKAADLKREDKQAGSTDRSELAVRGGGEGTKSKERTVPSYQSTLVVSQSLGRSQDKSLTLSSVAPPELRPDAEPQVATIRKSSLCLVTMPQQSIQQVKEEFRSEIISNAAMFKDVLQESGLGGSEDALAALSLHAAITKRQTDAICQANIQAEMRGYQFHSHQHSLDRESSEKRHEEVVSSLSGDKDWLQKLTRARDDCFSALKVALTRSYTLVLGFQPFLTGMRLLGICKGASLSVLVARGIERVSQAVSSRAFCGSFPPCLTPPPSRPFLFIQLTMCPQSHGPSSGSSFNPFSLTYWVFTAVGGYLPGPGQVLIDNSSCLLFNLTSLLSLVIGLSFATFLARMIGLPVVSASSGIAFSLFSGILSTDRFVKLLLSLVVFGTTAGCFILLLYRSTKKALQQQEATPSVKSLNLALDHFFSCKDIISIFPMAVLLYQLAEATGVLATS